MSSQSNLNFSKATTLSDALESAASLYPQKEAIVFQSRRIKYHELYEQVCLLSNLLIRYSIQIDSKIGILLPRAPEYIQAYFAAASVGAVIVPLNADLTPREVYSILDYCEVELLFTDAKRMTPLQDLLSLCTSLRTVFLFQQDGDSNSKNQSLPTSSVFPNIVPIGNLVTINRVELPDVSIDPGQLALLLHTSGTTSTPKRVMLSHRNVLTNAWSHIRSLGLRHEDKVLIALPMFFGYCNTAQMLAHILLAGTLVLLPGTFTPGSFCRLVEKEKITVFTGVPTMLFYLLEYSHLDKYDLSSLRFICFGGSVMPYDRLVQLTRTFPSIGFVQTYGQTEASPRITTLLPEDIAHKPSSVGRAIPGVYVSILNEDGQILAPYKVGEVAVQGANVMLGYFKRPDITREVLRNGYLLTGDIGYLDQEGYLFLVGRKKNIIIRGGINIYPEEIEEYLMEHPDVLEAVLIGERHPIHGEVPIAIVVLRDGHALSVEELVAYCRKGLTPHKIPQRIEFRDKLPKTYNQKIQRARLRLNIGEAD